MTSCWVTPTTGGRGEVASRRDREEERVVDRVKTKGSTVPGNKAEILSQTEEGKSYKEATRGQNVTS